MWTVSVRSLRENLMIYDPVLEQYMFDESAENILHLIIW